MPICCMDQDSYSNTIINQKWHSSQKLSYWYQKIHPHHCPWAPTKIFAENVHSSATKRLHRHYLALNDIQPSFFYIVSIYWWCANNWHHKIHLWLIFCWHLGPFHWILFISVPSSCLKSTLIQVCLHCYNTVSNQHLTKTLSKRYWYTENSTLRSGDENRKNKMDRNWRG